MGLTEISQLDAQSITSDLDGWGVTAVLTPASGQPASFGVLHTVHHMGQDTDGNISNTKQASIAVSMNLLDTSLYPYRNASGEVSFKNHSAVFNGSNYIVREWFPDETLRIVVLILGSI